MLKKFLRKNSICLKTLTKLANLMVWYGTVTLNRKIQCTVRKTGKEQTKIRIRDKKNSKSITQKTNAPAGLKKLIPILNNFGHTCNN
jgi:hypothetical protein